MCITKQNSKGIRRFWVNLFAKEHISGGLFLSCYKGIDENIFHLVTAEVLS